MDTSQLHFSDNTYSTDPLAMMVAGNAVPFAQWTTRDEPSGTQRAVPYADPTRTLPDYDAALGGAGSDADFLISARLQSRQSWQDGYSAATVVGYYQAGFNNAATGRNWAAQTPPIVTAVGVPPTVFCQRNVVDIRRDIPGRTADDPASLLRAI